MSTLYVGKETTDIKVLLSVHVSRSSQEEHDVQIAMV